MPYNSSYTGAEIDAAIATVKDTVTQGATTEVLVGGGASTDPVFTTATGTGAPVRAGSPTFTTKITTPQVTFPATDVPSADANTLDDYQEATWTPALQFGGASVNMEGTYGGSYTKIGNRVFIDGYIVLTDKGISTGAAQIKNLPYTIKNSLNYYPAVVLRTLDVAFADQVEGYGVINDTYIILEETTGADGTTTVLAAGDFQDTSQIIFSLNYTVA